MTLPQRPSNSSNVTYRINGNRTLISDLNLSIRRGETLMLLGRSGSGKTTTLKLINRLLAQSEGKVLVDGRSTAEWDVIQLRRHIGYAIQEAGLFPHYTVEDNVALVPRLERWDAPRIAARVREVLQLVGLPYENLPIAILTSFPAASASVSAWRERSPPIPQFY